MNETLNIKDLEYIVGLIDIAARRSCLQGEELLIVGSIREKFLRASTNSLEDDEGLTVQDFSIIVNLIEAITRRGGLTGEDILPVGIRRQKIINLVEQAKKENTEGDTNE